VKHIDLIIKNIGELVTFHNGPLRKVTKENAGIISRAAIAMDKGKVIEYGNNNEILTKYSSKEILDAEGRMVTPGLVDAHTHLIYAGSREDELELKLLGYTYSQILERGGGIHRTIRMTQNASIDELVKKAEKIIDTMISGGTTTVEVKSGYAIDVNGEEKMLKAAFELEKKRKIRIVKTLLAHVVPKDFPGDRKKYVEYFTETIIPYIRKTNLATYFDVFCDKGAFSVEETRIMLSRAVKEGFKLRIHADQLAYIGCSKLGEEFNIDSMDHLDRMPPENAEILARNGIAAVLLPTSMIAMRDLEVKPPIEEFRKKGVIMALGSDYNPNNQTPLVQTAMDLSTYLYGLTPLEALAAGTINSAYSLGIHEYVGSISKGKKADIVIWDVDNHNWIGYGWGFNKVKSTIFNGKIVFSKK